MEPSDRGAGGPQVSLRPQPGRPSMGSDVRRSALLAALVAAWLLIPSVASAARMDLDIKYPGVARAPSRGLAPVRIELVNGRSAGKGGGDWALIGVVRGTLGNAWQVVASQGGSSVERLGEDVVGDALGGAGVDVSADGAFAVRASLDELWCDGYRGYKMSTTMSVQLVSPDGQIVWEGRGHGSGGAALVGHSSSIIPGYSNALSGLAAELVSAFSSSEFLDALGGAGSAPGSPLQDAPFDSGTGPGPSPAAAQATTPVDPDQWASAVARWVVVDKKDGTEVRGVLLGLDEQTLVIQNASELVLAVDRVDVLQLRVR